jgi:hypothetical protein
VKLFGKLLGILILTALRLQADSVKLENFYDANIATDKNNLASLPKPEGLKKPVASYWDLAIKGSPEAAIKLVDCFTNGVGTSKNDALAEFWCWQAEKEGSSTAEALLGNMYWQGLWGQPVDPVKARQWFTKAAVDRNTISKLILAQFLLQGTGGPQNKEEGMGWLFRSAYEGDGPGEFALASNYFKGSVETPQDLRLAYLYSLLASSSRDLSENQILENNQMQKSLTGSMAPTDIVWLEDRANQIIKHRQKYGLALIDYGPEETLTIPPGGTGGDIQSGEFIQVMVNFGRGEFHRFIIDTGSCFSVISPELAAKLGLQPIGFAVEAGEHPQPEYIYAANGQIFGARFSNLRFVEMKFSKFFSSLGVEGILGGNFITQLCLKMDLEKRSVVFAPPESAATNMHKGVPLTFVNGCPYVNVTLESVSNQSFSVPAALDTGNSSLMQMNQKLNVKCPFAQLVAETSQIEIGGVYETRDQVQVGRLASVGIGGFRVAKPLIAYRPSSDRECNIGLSILRRFSVQIDYQSSELFLEPKDIDIPEPPYVDSGISFATKQYQIGGVFPNSPSALAGFAIGDVVKAIDGHLLSKLSSSQVAFLLGTGTHAVLVQRGGQERSLTLIIDSGI